MAKPRHITKIHIWMFFFKITMVCWANTVSSSSYSPNVCCLFLMKPPFLLVKSCSIPMYGVQLHFFECIYNYSCKVLSQHMRVVWIAFLFTPTAPPSSRMESPCLLVTSSWGLVVSIEVGGFSYHYTPAMTCWVPS